MVGYNLRNIRREFGETLTKKVSLMLDYTDQPGDIDDPWYTGEFGTVFAQITEGCEGLLAYLGY